MTLEIANAFLSSFGQEEGKSFDGFAPEAQDKILAHHWPGNVRELQNVIRNAVVLNDGSTIGADMLADLQAPTAPAHAPTPTAGITAVAASPIESSVDVNLMASAKPNNNVGHDVVVLGRPYKDIEKDVIEKTIVTCGGSIPKAAQLLQLSPSTIYRKRESWELD